jgi:hypothetical protein
MMLLVYAALSPGGMLALRQNLPGAKDILLSGQWFTRALLLVTIGPGLYAVSLGPWLWVWVLVTLPLTRGCAVIRRPEAGISRLAPRCTASPPGPEDRRRRLHGAFAGRPAVTHTTRPVRSLSALFRLRYRADSCPQCR